jgi:hypothetical protein
MTKGAIRPRAGIMNQNNALHLHYPATELLFK